MKNKKIFFVSLVLLLSFTLPILALAASNPYSDLVKGKQIAGFKPSGDFNRRVYKLIKSKYPSVVDDKVLMMGAKQELKYLLESKGLGFSWIDSMPADGMLLKKFIDKYKKSIPTSLAAYVFANGMIKSLQDPACEIILPADLREARMEAGFKGYGGLGVLIEKRGEDILVIFPFENGPALKAGLQGGDRILAVDGKSTKNFDLDSVLKRLRGPERSKVTLKIGRRGKILTKTIVRENVHLKPVYAGVMKNGTGYVKIVFFDENCTAEVYRAAGIFKEKNINKWVLDLRDNAGGPLPQLITLSSLFVKKGEPIMRIKYRDKPKTFVSAGIRRLDAPSAVVLNGYTTGTAEVFAAILEEYCGTKICGTKSAGNTAVSEFIKLPGGATLKLTVGFITTGKKRNLHKRGLTPQIPIPGCDDPANEARILKVMEDNF